MTKTHKKLSYKHGVFAALFAFLLVPVTVGAATDTATTTINANLGSTITLSTSGTVTLNVVPTGAGAMSSNFDTVTVATNNSSGYTLTLANTDADTDLEDGANAIAADSGTQVSPSSTLTNNRWGYRVDGLGGFGAGPTAAETNVASSAYSWAGVPATGSANTIKTTTEESGSDVTTVWFGVRADTSNPSGTYSDTVTYTATTNP